MIEQEEYEHGVGGYAEKPYSEPAEEIDDRDVEAISEDPETVAQQRQEAYWLRRARSTYSISTDYLTNSLTQTWEKNWKNFRNEHPSGSKYQTSAYKNRSKIFRPKLRSAMTARLSGLASALHSNDDLLSIKPMNQTSVESKASADIHKELLQWRLENTIPWFQTSLGAYQSCDIYNVCITRQDWDYQVMDTSEYEQAKDEDGNPVFDDDGNAMGYKTRDGVRVVADKPRCELIMPENFRFSTASSWVDPVQDSPFLIEDMPMFAGDVFARMNTTNPMTGEPQWRQLSLAQIVSAGQSDATDMDTVRQSREGEKRRDPADHTSDPLDTLVWVRRYIIRDGYDDITFYTLGDTYLLTDPVPLEDVCKLGRNYVIGTNNIEIFRHYPMSGMELGAPLQEEINDTSNQRMDNVKLVLNKRYFIKRQKQGGLDLQSLMRNVPGGGVLVDDPTNDVKVIDTPDITSSSYQENDRLAVELDELLGNFSQSSVQNNRTLGETVGGMNKLSDSASEVQELSFKIFVKTWVEPVLKQLIKLEAHYETDETILALAGQKSQVFLKYGIDTITDELLDQNLLVKVNVGMGHTNPTQKVQKLAMGVDMVSKMPMGMERLNVDELSKEVWGYLGFPDGGRFLVPLDQVEQPDPMANPEIQLKMADLERKKMADQALVEYRNRELDNKRELQMAEIAARQQIKITELEQRTGIDAEKIRATRDATALRETNKSRELAIKTKTGSGI